LKKTQAFLPFFLDKTTINTLMMPSQKIMYINGFLGGVDTTPTKIT
jgi:hypothetical protein